MLDVLNHCKDHCQWMVETFDNGPSMYTVYEKIVKAYDSPSGPQLNGE